MNKSNAKPRYIAETKKFTHVYRATCTKTGMQYIGSHTSDNLQTDTYVGSGKKWLQHLKDNDSTAIVETIESFDSMWEAKLYENKLLSQEIGTNSMLMNESTKGSGGNYGEEVNAKISATHKKLWEDNYEERYNASFNEEVNARRGATISQNLKANPYKLQRRMNALNKNPEKIAKTAETHRGMKRSDNAKSNISQARKESLSNKTESELAESIGKGMVYKTDLNDRYIAKRVPSDYKLKNGEKFGVVRPPQAQGRGKGYKKTIVTNMNTGEHYGLYLDLFPLLEHEKIGKHKTK